MARLPRDERLQPSRVTEGDEVVLNINPHSWLKYGSMLKGTVTEAPSKSTREWWREGNGRPMDDIVVEGTIADDRDAPIDDNAEWPTGTVVWRYHIDNGYVTGPVDAPNRPSRSDIGRIDGFWPHSALDG